MEAELSMSRQFATRAGEKMARMEARQRAWKGLSAKNTQRAWAANVIQRRARIWFFRRRQAQRVDMQRQTSDLESKSLELQSQTTDLEGRRLELQQVSIFRSLLWSTAPRMRPRQCPKSLQIQFSTLLVMSTQARRDTARRFA